ncbi:Uncharacterized protein Rs2_37726 [Raphanus sativus]|nr:Uncharacterized protein Rs2_37726 [Raphanus sativus]
MKLHQSETGESSQTRQIRNWKNSSAPKVLKADSHHLKLLHTTALCFQNELTHRRTAYPRERMIHPESKQQNDRRADARKKQWKIRRNEEEIFGDGTRAHALAITGKGI